VKRILVGLCGVLVLSVCVAWMAGQGTVVYAGEPGITVGLGSLPTIGWTHFDDAGNLVRVTGLNLALGYSARYFTSVDGLQPDRFNNYWGWGTFALIIPYLEFGWLYAIPMGAGSDLFAIDLGFIYIFPRIGLGFYF